MVWLCQATCEKAQVGEVDPGGAAGDGGFEILGETPTAAQPGEAALDHPAPGQQLKAFDAGRPLDDLDGPGTATIRNHNSLKSPKPFLGRALRTAPKRSETLP